MTLPLTTKIFADMRIQRYVSLAVKSFKSLTNLSCKLCEKSLRSTPKGLRISL